MKITPYIPHYIIPCIKSRGKICAYDKCYAIMDIKFKRIDIIMTWLNRIMVGFAIYLILSK